MLKTFLHSYEVFRIKTLIVWMFCCFEWDSNTSTYCTNDTGNLFWHFLYVLPWREKRKISFFYYFNMDSISTNIVIRMHGSSVSVRIICVTKDENQLPLLLISVDKWRLPTYVRYLDWHVAGSQGHDDDCDKVKTAFRWMQNAGKGVYLIPQLQSCFHR